MRVVRTNYSWFLLTLHRLFNDDVPVDYIEGMTKADWTLVVDQAFKDGEVVDAFVRIKAIIKAPAFVRAAYADPSLLTVVEDVDTPAASLATADSEQLHTPMHNWHCGVG